MELGGHFCCTYIWIEWYTWIACPFRAESINSQTIFGLLTQRRIRRYRSLVKCSLYVERSEKCSAQKQMKTRPEALWPNALLSEHGAFKPNICRMWTRAVHTISQLYRSSTCYTLSIFRGCAVHCYYLCCFRTPRDSAERWNENQCNTNTQMPTPSIHPPLLWSTSSPTNVCMNRGVHELQLLYESNMWKRNMIFESSMLCVRASFIGNVV